MFPELVLAHHQRLSFVFFTNNYLFITLLAKAMATAILEDMHGNIQKLTEYSDWQVIAINTENSAA